MTITSPSILKHLISVGAHEDKFYCLVWNLQSVYKYLQHNHSSRCEDNYVRLMAHLLENYLDTSKKLALRKHLGDIIARQSKDKFAARYFKQRCAHANILDLLKQHHQLTGQILVLTSVDYDRHKFHVKLS